MPVQETIPKCELRLARHELNALLDQLDVNAGEKPASRRKHERVPHRVSITVTAHFGGRSPDIILECVLRNLSLGGICFIAGMVVTPGTRISVEIPAKTNGGKLLRTGIVRRCNMVRGRIHEIGAEITNPGGEKPATENPE